MPNPLHLNGITRVALLGLTLAFAFGCASAKVTQINRVGPDFLPRPDRVLVYDVAATPEELPADSPLKPHASPRDRDQTAEDVQVGRELGAQIAKELTKRLMDLGLPAVRATSAGSQERAGDLVIRGAFVEVDKGNMALRFLVGFGAGNNSLQTHFDVFQLTANGRTQLGTAGLKAAGGHMPGVLLSMGVGGVVKGLAVGGALATGREFSSESLGGAAERTAKEFIKTVKPDLVRRGWVKE